jgi:hypothetical protein
MRINQVVRVICLVVVMLINFFGIIMLINVTGAVRTEADKVNADTQKQNQIISAYQAESQRKLNSSLLTQQQSESMQKILSSDSLKISDIQSSNQGVIIR